MKKRPILYNLAAVIIIVLLLTGCGKPAAETPAPTTPQKAEYHFEQVYEAAKFNLGFSYPSQWEVIEEEKQDGTLTLRLRDKSDHSSSLIVLVRPGQPENKELLADAHTLLEKSLYLARDISQGKEQEVEGLPVLFLTAESGGSSTVNSKAAVFTKGGYSYLLVVVARQEVYSEVEGFFEKIVHEAVS